MILSRRKLIGGLGLLIASPAIVRASSLMPVKAWDDPGDIQALFDKWVSDMQRFYLDAMLDHVNGQSSRLIPDAARQTGWLT